MSKSRAEIHALAYLMVVKGRIHISHGTFQRNPEIFNWPNVLFKYTGVPGEEWVVYFANFRKDRSVLCSFK